MHCNDLRVSLLLVAAFRLRLKKNTAQGFFHMQHWTNLSKKKKANPPPVVLFTKFCICECSKCHQKSLSSKALANVHSPIMLQKMQCEKSFRIIFWESLILLHLHEKRNTGSFSVDCHQNHSPGYSSLNLQASQPALFLPAALKDRALL